MHTLAIIYLVSQLLLFLPGTRIYKTPRDINWEGPGIYIGLTCQIAAIALAITVLTNT